MRAPRVYQESLGERKMIGFAQGEGGKSMENAGNYGRIEGRLGRHVGHGPDRGWNG